MTFFNKAFKWFLASNILISSLFVFNFYAVFDDQAMDGAQCYALFKSNSMQICYDFKYRDLNFCPIDDMRGFYRGQVDSSIEKP